MIWWIELIFPRLLSLPIKNRDALPYCSGMAMSAEIFDLKEVHEKLMDIEKKATIEATKHNQFLKELGVNADLNLFAIRRSITNLFDFFKFTFPRD